MNNYNPIVSALTAGGLLISSTLAVAAPTPFTWVYNDNTPSTWSSTAEGATSVGTLSIVNATAWANTGGSGFGGIGNTYSLQNLEDSGAQSLRVLTVNGGLTESGSAPNHALDNEGAQEFILFEFSEKVSLNQLRISYPGSTGTGAASSADMTILAYTGADKTTAEMETLLTASDSRATAGELGDTSLWTQKHFTANTSGNPNDFTDLGSDLPASKFWLIGAYNQHIGGTSGAFDDTKDYIKLAALGGKIPDQPGGGGSVPEPTTLGLAALGLLGLRRWKKKA